MPRMLAGVGGLLRWVVWLVVSLYLSTLLVFVALEVSIDGGMTSVVLGAGQSVDNPRFAEDVDAYNLRDAVPVRHAKWFIEAAQGDFNRSLNRNAPVGPMLQPRLPISFEIAIVGLFVAGIIGTAVGFLGATLRRTPARVLHGTAVSTLQSTPAFILAAFGTWMFAVRLGWLPAAGWERLSTSATGNLERLIMPVLAIALPEAGIIARIVQTSTQRVLNEEYIVAAQAKGLPRRQILFRHALRPASMTLLTQLGLVLGSLLSGVIIVERMFGIGGMGSVVLDASTNRDLHVLAAATGYITFIIVVVRAISDATYRWADPRIASRPVS